MGKYVKDADIDLALEVYKAHLSRKPFLEICKDFNICRDTYYRLLKKARKAYAEHSEPKADAVSDTIRVADETLSNLRTSLKSAKSGASEYRRINESIMAIEKQRLEVAGYLTHKIETTEGTSIEDIDEYLNNLEDDKLEKILQLKKEPKQSDKEGHDED